MRKLLVLLLLVAPATPAMADGHHSCVIDRIEVGVHRREVSGLYHLDVRYLAKDGHLLTQERCPDQTQPSWSFSKPITWDRAAGDAVLDPYGYDWLIALPPGPITVQITTVQGHFVGAPDPELPTRTIVGSRTFVAR